ncbi:MAG TPA: hypothetical protein VFG60_09370 [Burkholderiaceae bacterium]|nr:hypothetical protein [Burkholderiaceae bacterium]
MDITFEQACNIVAPALRGDVRREIVAGLAGKTLGASLLALRDAMRANRFRAVGQQIFLDRVVSSFDGRTRGEGFHILHDWDGVAQQTNPDIIPVDVLHFLVDQRGAEPATDTELAILLDYYLMHVLSLLTLRVWDDGDPNENYERLNAMLADLQGPRGSGQQFASDAETLMLIGTSHNEPAEWGYARLLAKVRTLGQPQQFRIGLGHASSMGCHLRFGFEAQCGRDTLLLRDDNISDYPWLCFALAAVMREYQRLVDAGGVSAGTPAERHLAVIEETLLNGLTADARAFIGVPPASLSESEADRVRFVDGFTRHRAALLESFEKYRPTDQAYSPLSFFFNFSHNVVKGAVVDALLWGEAWDVSLNDLLTGVTRAGIEDGSQQLLAVTLMAYARSNPDRIRGKLMPVIVYDPQAGRRAYTVAMEKLSQ